MRATSLEMKDRLKLDKYAYGIDGMMAVFRHMPRKLPIGYNYQSFWSRKQNYAINVLMLCNQKCILAVDADYAGSTHDSRIYKNSEIKPFVESSPYNCAGDSAFQLGKGMITPYPHNQIAGTRGYKAKFNHAHSQVRTVMTENIFGRLTKLFPTLKTITSPYMTARKTIIAACILFNVR